jgi:hypothetical protein
VPQQTFHCSVPGCTGQSGLHRSKQTEAPLHHSDPVAYRHAPMMSPISVNDTTQYPPLMAV